MTHPLPRSLRATPTRRRAVRSGIAVLAATTLVACSGGSAEEGEEPGEEPAESQTLTLWANTAIAGDSDSPLQEAARAFGEANDVTVEIQGIATTELVPNLTTAVTGGGGPDVAIVDSSSIPQLAASEVLTDISSQAEAVSGDFHEGAWQYSQYDGKQYGVPFDSSNTALFYNVAMLEDAGVEVPTTWEELREAALELTDGEVYGYMLGAAGYGSFSFWPWLWQNGGQIASEDVSSIEFNSPEGHEAFEFYANLYLEDEVVPPDFLTVTSSWDEYIAPFVQERVAMMAVGPWVIESIREGNPELDFAVAPLPEGEEAATILGGASLGVAASAENPELAWEFIEWFTAADQMHYTQDMGRIPGRVDVIESDWAQEDPIRQVFIEQMPDARARPAHPLWGDVEWGIFATAWDSVIQGQKTPAEALDDAAEEAEATLTEN
ncbi:sugar ABC transporter substrate-binding protein [Georgenia sp. H159]|uniref:sugar ABC transporter substrate-binding protein n=1 Tax=Georgenia sp. H159 TaxID=3076115 RepID=UPI002D7A3561|nr:sugar ABC transporter substrate-binding protein [Georgenia sp. H159]